MSLVSREMVMAALFTKLEAAVLRGVSPPNNVAFPFASRNWVPAAELGVNQKPALFMLEEDEMMERRRAGMPPRRLTMRVNAIIISSSSGLKVPAQALNPLLDAIDDVLSVSPNLLVGRQTLSSDGNGPAFDAWISGTIVKVPGYQDGLAVANVPIEVLIP